MYREIHVSFTFAYLKKKYYYTFLRIRNPFNTFREESIITKLRVPRVRGRVCFHPEDLLFAIDFQLAG